MTNKIICHRGINRKQENTFKSITDTSLLNSTDKINYGVEFDVQITADDNIICYHDDTLERLHKSNKRVSEITKDDIDHYNLPYFDKVIEKLSLNRNIIIDVEIKIYYPIKSIKIDILCNKIIDACKMYNVINQCIFSSFDDNILMKLLKINKDMKIAKIADQMTELYGFVKLRNLGVNILVTNKNMIIELFDKYKMLIADMDLYIYTLYDNNNNDDDFVDMIKEKNVGLITDNYERVLKQLL